MSAEKVAANTLCDLLRSSVEDGVKDDLEHKIVEQMKRYYNCLYSKRKFKIAILEKLVTERSFSKYLKYLTDMLWLLS